MTLSREVKQRIIDLAQHTSKSQREIARELNIHHKTVQRILSVWHDTGSLEEVKKENRGRKSKIDCRTGRLLARESKKNPQSCARQIQVAAGPAAREISLRTVQRCLKKLDRRAYRPIKVPCLNKQQCLARLNLARELSQLSTEDFKEVNALSK